MSLKNSSGLIVNSPAIKEKLKKLIVVTFGQDASGRLARVMGLRER